MDYDRLGWYFSKQNLKNYFKYGIALKKYLNNQIYPKYKDEIDNLLVYQNKMIELKKDIKTITTIKNLELALTLIQKHNIDDQQILKKVYQLNKDNKDKVLLQKLIDKIDNNELKTKFEESKWYQPKLFDASKCFKIANFLYNMHITKQRLSSASGYMTVINKYIHQITKSILNELKDDSLVYNIYIKIKVNKNEIKSNKAKDFNFIFIQLYSSQITNKQLHKIGINCPNSFVVPSYLIDKPKQNEGYTSFDDGTKFTQPHIHIGMTANNFKKRWKDEYENVLQHQLIHVFEMYYGYANKNLDYNCNQECYQQSLEYIDNDDDMSPLLWQTQDYWSIGHQFTPYLANLISLFKNAFQNGVSKKQLVEKIRNVKFDNWQETNDLIEFLIGKQYLSDSPIIWLYQLKNKDKKLFEYAKRKLINKILKF